MRECLQGGWGEIPLYLPTPETASAMFLILSNYQKLSKMYLLFIQKSKKLNKINASPGYFGCLFFVYV